MNKELSANTTLSHYRIVSKIGEGGMGEVWLAEDTRLGRKVALKLLPAEFTEDSERVRRFTQEAKAASALNHPNIISVYDIGESETGRFIVMEFVAGHTLRSVIAKDNSLETLFTLGAQMAKALSAAHAAGITHRDIKPDNIMVRDDGYVKMLDFGLARLLPTTSSDPEAMTLAQQTTPGTVMGTLAYMSPEQARGQTAASGSDVFALGIVLYELATGHHPFKSETMIGYLHAITLQVPPSMTSIKSDLPLALDDLILRMLEKDVRQRPTASEVAQALQEIEKYGSSNTLPFRVADKPKTTRGAEGFLVAVLPFKSSGTAGELKELVEGLSEEIVTGLSRFSYLRVISHRDAAESSDVKTLGARYVIEGSLRQSGTKLRLAVQLVDTTTGAHLWAETYDRPFSSEDIFELQDDLAPRVVSTVADQYGALVHSMSESLRGRSAGQYSAHEAMLRAFGYWERMTPEEHAEVRDILEAAIAVAPDHSDCLAELAMIYWHEYAFGYNLRPDPIGRARAAAQRAVASAPTSHFAHCALATSLYFQKDYQAFRPAAERALALNRMDSSTAAILGNMIAYAGDWEYGLGIVERAMQLNPHHGGWYHYVAFCDAYRKRDYRDAMAIALKVNMPAYHWPHVYLAAACGQLGEQQRASVALRELHALVPNFGAIAREEFGKWLDPELTEHLLEGLRKAGLEIADEDRRADTSSGLHSSGVKRADEGFWVAVLPFKFTGSNTEVATLAEGLSEEIVTGLSRFSYLRVISRSSTLRYATETSDVRTVGNSLGARYVLEGSLRIAGSSLRVTVQLVDSSTGAHLWVETYKRSINTDDIFELQDDLASRIVSTIADMNGVLPHTMGEMLRQRDPTTLTPYESVLRAFAFVERLTAEEHVIVRAALERAVEQAPEHPDCLAMLAMIYDDEHKQGFNPQPNSLDRALAMAQRAVAAGPSNHIAHAALAQTLFFRRDLQSFRSAANRALALNPMDAYTTAFMGILIAYSGDWEYGSALAEKGMELNPNHPGWYRFCSFFREYGRHEYRAALDIAVRMNMPSYFYTHAALAAAYAQLGEMENARTSLRELMAQRPDFGAQARELYQKWFGAGELLEDVLDGLRKAGLEISDTDVLSTPSAVSSETRADEGFWVAVLPFKATGTDAGLSTFAEGLSDEIVTGLNRFSYLRVIARSSTLRYANQTSDVRNVGKQLGARYVLEGSLRQAGSVLRVSVQLVDANTGAHVWAETYDRPFHSEEIFAVQDELVPKIVSSVADMHGALPRSMSEVVRKKAPDQLSPYEALLRSFGYNERFTPAELAEVRSCLERAVQEAPANGDCWAMLSVIYADEYGHWHIHQPDSLDKALTAARTAVQAAPLHSLPYYALAQALFFCKEMRSFRVAAERAVSLNPMDGATAAFMGLLIAYSGDWERGCALSDKGLQLNPNHPGWYHYTAWHDAYRKQDYQVALDIALKLNAPDNFYTHAVLAMCYAQLGHMEAAHKSLRDMLVLKPDYAIVARELHGKWIEPDLVEQLMDGLRKAGLEIGNAEQPVAAFSSTPYVSTEARSDEGFWVAVLPFKFTGSNTEVATLAEGLSEEIITGLSRFSYLRVISRSSTLRYANETDDVRDVGKTLGARYVMEGSLRIAGSSLRVSVQLIDANTGAHLWAETYDRQFRAEEVFALQDDLVPRIVSTIADVNGVLPRSMSEVVCSKDPDELSPYEAVLRSFRYFDRVTAEELAAARSCLEIAVKKAPTNADAWAMLALLFAQDYGQGFNLHSDALNSATMAAQRAVESGPSNHLAYFSLAQARFFQKDIQSFRNAAERAVALNPMDAHSLAFMGELLTYVGDSERGLALATRAKEINPNHPGWFWYADYFHAYRQGDYRNALSLILKANLPGHWGMHAGIAAAAGQVGDSETASKAIRDLLKLRPDYGVTVHSTLAKWFDPELCEQLLDGLRKAGLKISGEGATRRDGDGATAFSSSSSFSRPSIVVLPFVNRSPDADNEYFSDGLTEEIISDLSVIKALRVISRNSSMTFKGTSKDTLSIAKELGVSYVVSGSVRKVGDDLRITVELVEGAGDTPLWSDKYSGTIANIFGFQEEISRKIVTALEVRLTEAETQFIAERPIDNAAAYDCYMRARHEIYLFTAEGLDRAQKLVDSALSLIGENSLLLATRGLVSWYYLNFSIRPEVKYLDEAAAYATKSLEQDPQSCFGIFLRGLVAAKRGDIESTLRDLRTAHEQKPGDSMVLNELIRHLTSAGQELSESSRKMYEESLRLDPLHPLNWAQAAWRHFNAGRLAESIEAARRIFLLTDRGNPARVYAAYYLAIANVPEEAINLFEEEGAALAGTAYGSMSLFLNRALQGDAEGAIKHVTPQLEKASSWTEYLALLLADGYSLIGDHDAALKWLRTAVDQGFINYPYLATRDPFLVNVRTDPRFAELMREVKPRWERGQVDAGTGSHGDAEKERDTRNNLDIVSFSSAFTASPRPPVSVSPSICESPSIAVLPFVNISSDHDNEYFCDGLAEELLNALAKIESLRVAARTSTFSFKGKETDIRDVGAKLNVSTVLEGSVRKSGNRIRISAQLVDVADGYQLWSEQYDRQLEDIFDIQDEIALAIVNALKVRLLGAQKRAIVKRYTDNTEAYQLYLKGRFFVNQRTSQSLLKAIDYFNQSIALDANYALGYAGLADAYMVLGVPDAVTEALSPIESLIKARAAAEKALEIDSSVGEVYAVLAHIKWKERDWAGAEKDYKRSIDLKPQNPIAHFYYAVCLAGLGRKEEAVREIMRAQQLDPLSLPVNASVVYVLYLCRQYDEAIEAGKRTLELDSTFPLTHQRLGLPYVQKNLYSEAINEFQQAVKNSNRAPQPLVSLGHAYAVSGNKIEAEKILAELQYLSPRRYVSPYGIATIYVGLGETEQAFEWLEKAFDEGNTELTFLKVDPRLDPLREDPRFSELRERVGFTK